MTLTYSGWVFSEFGPETEHIELGSMLVGIRRHLIQDRFDDFTLTYELKCLLIGNKILQHSFDKFRSIGLTTKTLSSRMKQASDTEMPQSEEKHEPGRVEEGLGNKDKKQEYPGLRITLPIVGAVCLAIFLSALVSSHHYLLPCASC